MTTEALDIRIITALPSEAKPINHHLGLARNQHVDAFSLFDNQQIKLIISGIGSAAATDVITWFETHYPSTPQTRWLNIGIAGHATRPLGDAVLVQRAFNQLGQQLEVSTPVDPPCDPIDLLTVEHPLPDYPDERIYDMEAYHFFDKLRQATPGTVQALKVISDNRDSPIEHISGKLVRELIRNQLDKLDAILAYWSSQLDRA